MKKLMTVLAAIALFAACNTKIVETEEIANGDTTFIEEVDLNVDSEATELLEIL